MDLEAVADHFDLGRPLGPGVEVHGGLLNRLWQVTTDQGRFAVKELNLGRDWMCDHQAVLAFEQAAFAAGVPMAEPVPDPEGRAVAVMPAGESVLVHRWVDGDPVPVGVPISETMAADIGAALAVIHRLEVDRRPFEREHDEPFPDEAEWTALVERSRAEAMPWAGSLEAAVADLAELGRLLAVPLDPDDPPVLCHRDINAKNLLAVAGRPVILDWEAAGIMPVGSDLGGCLNMALSEGLQLREPAAALLGAYAAAGGRIPEVTPRWLVEPLSGGAWFLRWNILRCLAGGEQAGQPLTVAHRVIADELATIPFAMRTLDDRLALLRELRAGQPTR